MGSIWRHYSFWITSKYLKKTIWLYVKDWNLTAVVRETSRQILSNDVARIRSRNDVKGLYAVPSVWSLLWLAGPLTQWMQCNWSVACWRSVWDSVLICGLSLCVVTCYSCVIAVYNWFPVSSCDDNSNACSFRKPAANMHVIKRGNAFFCFCNIFAVIIRYHWLM